MRGTKWRLPAGSFEGFSAFTLVILKILNALAVSSAVVRLIDRLNASILRRIVAEAQGGSRRLWFRAEEVSRRRLRRVSDRETERYKPVLRRDGEGLVPLAGTVESRGVVRHPCKSGRGLA